MLKFSVQIPQVPKVYVGAVDRIRKRFQKEAADLVLTFIRKHLGTDIYTLSPSYAAVKPRLKGFRRFAGKSGDQPLIFSGEMYNALSATIEGDELIIGVAEGAGVSESGFDYSEHWEQMTQFLERGLDDVEYQLDDLLADIIVSEMLL